MKYCQNCGQPVEENATFCQNCGQNQNESVQVAPAAPSTVSSPYAIVDKNATTGMILGIIAVIAWLLPLVGYPVTICGIVFSTKGLRSVTKKGNAIAGLILSVAFLIATLVNSFLGALMQLGAM